MRYVLWSGDVGIPAVDQEAGIVVTVNRSWRQGLTDLAALVGTNGDRKISTLEINCHGRPGELMLQPKGVDFRSVATFGAGLASLMDRNGLIELMACDVAGLGQRVLVNGPSQYTQAVLDGYFGGWEKDPVYMEKGEDGVARVLPYTGEKLANFLAKMKTFRSTKLWEEGNGLHFCLALARAAGCTVRASRLPQAEEIGDFNIGTLESPIWRQDHPIMRNYDRFGNWEGPVWDFRADGQVKYLGCNLQRQRFPQQRVGPQLTYNFREQGGNGAGAGQRPQRMNRSPLPV